MTKAKNARKRLFSLFLALAMVLTSVAVPQTTAEAAKKVKVKKVQITSPKKKTVTLVKGKTLQIKVKVTPKNAKNKKVTYKSSKKKIASVTSKGKVKGIKKGTAKITVTAKDGSKKKATLTVKVVNPVKVKSVKLNKTAVTIDAGKTYTLKATITPKNATNKAVTWKTSNKGVATVTSKGVVKGVKAGTATITATAKDGSKKKASLKVTVKAASTPTPPGPKPPGPNPPVTEKTLDSIEVTTAPAKIEYIAGETLDLTGMVVTAKYSDNTTKVVPASEYTTSPAEGTVLASTRRSFSVSYKEGTVTKRATVSITVKGVTAISIKTQPTKTTYQEGEKFDPAGMVVEAELSDETTKEITGYTYSQEDLAVTAGSQYTAFKISYATGTNASDKVETETNITVTANNPLKSISVELLEELLEREGAHFQKGDVKVTATFNDNTTKEIDIKDCQVDPNEFTKETTAATVTYWYGGVEKSDEVTGFTVTAYRARYTFEDADTVGTIVKRANESGDAVPTEDNAADVNLGEDDFVNGVTGKALKMNGTYGLRLDDIAGTPSKSYSISAWFKPEVGMKGCQALIISTADQFGLPKNSGRTETWCAVAGNGNAGQDSDNKLKLWSYDPDISWTQVGNATANPIPIGLDGAWTHVALVVDNDGEPSDDYATGTLYVNGRKVTSGKVRNEKKGDLMKTYLGVTGWAADGYFKGLVDELVFTSEVLAAPEVEAYYLEGHETSGNQADSITAVSPGDGEEVEVPYGTSLADVKRELMKIAYKAKAAVEGEDQEIALPTTSDMWTVEDYSTSAEGEATATVRLQAPEGYLYNIDGKQSVSVRRTVKVKITEPIVITTVTPSITSITVPYGQSEENIIKALNEQVTFTAAAADGTPYTVTANAGAWELTAKDDPAAGYDAVFKLRNPASVGYKFAESIEIKATVNFQAATTITALTAEKTEIEVVAGTEEDEIKSQLAGLKLTATVEGDAQLPEITNAAALWTITEYDKDTAGTYPATATFTAPVGYKFADGVGTISASVKVKALTTEKNLDSIAIDKTSAHRTKLAVGHAFDKTGLVVRATYTNGDVEDVSGRVTVADTVYNELGRQTVTVSYSEGEGENAVTKTATLEINVVPLEQTGIGYYKFEGNLKNEITNANAVTANLSQKGTGTSSLDGLGVKGNALQLNSDTGEGVKLDTSINTANFSVSMWVKAKDLTKNNYSPVFYTRKEANNDKNLMIWFANYKSDGSLSQNANFVVRTVPASWSPAHVGHNASNNPLVEGQWKMITFTMDGTTGTVYVDGVQQEVNENMTNTFADAASELYLGICGYDKTFTGAYDEVSIYDYALSADDVKTLYDRVDMTPTIVSVTTDKTEIELLKVDAGENNAGIQAMLKALEIQTTMRFGDAPEFDKSADWTLTEKDGGYTATKTLSVPENYVLDGSEEKTITLTVDVTVIDAQLGSIRVTKEPEKTTYVVGETFDKTGMEITASYTEGVADRIVTNFTVENEDQPLTKDNTAITVKYSQGGVEKTATVTITVRTVEEVMSEVSSARTAYYTFDNNSLANTLDNSKAAVGATHKSLAETGMPEGSFVTGIKGTGIKTDGTGVKLAEEITTSTFTINFWVNPTALDRTFAPVLFGTEAVNTRQLALLADATGKSDMIRLYDGSAEPDISNILTVGTWTMLTWVNDGGTLKIYKDGVEKYSGASSITAVKGLYLGAGCWDQAFQGTFDEVSLFGSTALTDVQVKGLYKSVADASEQPETPTE